MKTEIFNYSYIDTTVKICDVEKIQEYRKWARLIPFIQFPSDWEIQMIPPLGGAIIRFLVKRSGEKKEISVYLDCYDRLGIFGAPYWEIYPYNDDVYRCKMEDTKDLMDAIDYALGNKRTYLNKNLI